MGHIGGTVGCVTSLGFGGKFLSVAWNNTEVEDMVDVSYFHICGDCRILAYEHLCSETFWNLKAKLLFEEKFGSWKTSFSGFYVELQVYEAVASMYYCIKEFLIFQTNWVFVRKHFAMKFDVQTSIVTLSVLILFYGCFCRKASVLSSKISG